ncbi:DUF4365 domain-containing protein [Cryobacterium sp. TMT1-3]|uniref:DUF4365 domain-containing protein n=1 Tax=Cryobacterium sp. TMT1-3 TaxID=1259237 RepID=UPI00106D6E5D|nr:DUF4365 domain-containing protein [Cryobacterium sp. TMT1-3]TFC26591.1 DUF4365 domain-containing protein [Cryobacterium sp. TMT1-3]
MIFHINRLTFKAGVSEDDKHRGIALLRRQGESIPGVKSFVVGPELGGDFEGGAVFVIDDLDGYSVQTPDFWPPRKLGDTEGMTQLPSVGNQTFTEREGIIHIAREVNRARCVWRETVSVDVGIDGQIEYVNDDGQATGRMVFVQVKSGVSYFKGATTDSVPFYPSAKHKSYWERAPLPVILVLHDEMAAETFWVDARDALRRGEEIIQVPKVNVFNAGSVRSVLSTNEPLPVQPMPMSSLAQTTMGRTSPSAGLPVDFLDLFLHGLMNLGRSVYFGMDLVVDVARAKLDYADSEFGLGLGAPEYDFIRDYVLFLAEQDLARVDFDEFNREWDRGLVGRFMAPLTIRGRSFTVFLNAVDDSDQVRAVQDKAFSGIEAFESLRRVPVVEKLKARLASS